MAKTVTIAQSTGTNNVNTVNGRTVAKAVGIVFHSDRFKVGARCRLYSAPDNDAAKQRITQLKADP